MEGLLNPIPTEAGVMKTKWISFLLIALLILGPIACQTTENRRAQIICRPSSASIGSTGEGGAITIAWDPNREPDLAGYRVYYGTASGNYEGCVDIGNPPKSSPGRMEYTLAGLDKGKKYYIAVAAYDKNKEASGFSSEVSGLAK
jgi:hypothetical protein